MSEYTPTTDSVIDGFIEQLYEKVSKVTLETGLVPTGFYIDHKSYEHDYVEAVVTFGLEEQ